MCRRNTKDPLMRLFLDKYFLHLLPIPRQDLTVGFVYPHKGKKTLPPGHIKHLVNPPLKVPSPRIGEAMSDVVGEASDSVDAKLAFGLLGGFFQAIGAASLITSFKASFEAAKANKLAFSFESPTRDWIDPFEMEALLRAHEIDVDRSVMKPDHDYYLVTAVARTNSLSISAETDSGGGAELEIGALEVTSASEGVKVRKTSKGEVVFSGEKQLTFGVELHHLTFDTEKRRLGLAGVQELIAVRRMEKVPTASFIGSSDDGEAFLEEAS